MASGLTSSLILGLRESSWGPQNIPESTLLTFMSYPVFPGFYLYWHFLYPLPAQCPLLAEKTPLFSVILPTLPFPKTHHHVFLSFFSSSKRKMTIPPPPPSEPGAQPLAPELELCSVLFSQFLTLLRSSYALTHHTYFLPLTLFCISSQTLLDAQKARIPPCGYT